MCEKEMDIEEFVKKNKEKIEKILNEQKSSFKEKAEPQMKKAEDVVTGVLSLFLDPEIQKHFVKAGFEVLAGVEEFLKKAPMPDKMKETFDKASGAKETFVKDVMCEVNPDCKVKNKDKKMKKIDVE